MSTLPFTTIIVATPWLAEHDAISNDAYWQQQLLLKSGFATVLYAEGSSPQLKDKLITWEKFQELIADPKALLIYHHGVYWHQGEHILQKARCKIVLKYHNITPPEFYRGYDKPGTYATEQGRDQTGRLLKAQKFDYILGDSHYNISDLQSYGYPLPPSSVAAPFTQLQDFDGVEEDTDLAKRLNSDGTANFLFVGRVVPNKGHLHLIEVLNRYIELFGPKVILNVVGGVAMSEDTYFKEIEVAVNARSLGSNIIFHQKLGFAGIKTLYKNSDAFLLMSEHEGFCVPILESQTMDLPVIALNRGAVAETLGQGQIVFDTLDFDAFATALQRVTRDKDLRKVLIENGRINKSRFSPEAILKGTINSLQQMS